MCVVVRINGLMKIPFEDLLLAVGHSIAIQGKANVKRNRLLKFLVERSDFSGTNKVVFSLMMLKG